MIGEKNPPTPPDEWSAVKRARMAVAIKAAHLFLLGFEASQIASKVGRDVSKARIGQLVARGCGFLLQRNFVRAA